MALRMARLGLALLALGMMVVSPAFSYSKPPDLPGVAQEPGTPDICPVEELNNQVTPLFPALATWVHTKKTTTKTEPNNKPVSPKGSISLGIGITSKPCEQGGLLLPCPCSSVSTVFVGWKTKPNKVMVAAPGWIGWVIHHAHVKMEIKTPEPCCEQKACVSPKCEGACAEVCPFACKSVCQPACGKCETTCCGEVCPVNTGCVVQQRWLLKAFRHAVEARNFEKASELAAQILALEKNAQSVKCEDCEGCPACPFGKVHVIRINHQVTECECEKKAKCCDECKCKEGKKCPECKCDADTSKCKCKPGKGCCDECKCKEGKKCPKCNCDKEEKGTPVGRPLQELIEDIDAPLDFINGCAPNNQPVQFPSYSGTQFIPWLDSYDSYDG